LPDGLTSDVRVTAPRFQTERCLQALEPAVPMMRMNAEARAVPRPGADSSRCRRHPSKLIPGRLRGTERVI